MSRRSLQAGRQGAAFGEFENLLSWMTLDVFLVL
jgi:hypothetical protein